MKSRKNKILLMTMALAFMLTACQEDKGKEVKVGAEQELIEDKNSPKNQASFSKTDRLKDYLLDMEGIENVEPCYQIVFAFDQLPEDSIPYEQLKLFYKEMQATVNQLIVWEMSLDYMGYYGGSTAFVKGYEDYIREKDKPEKTRSRNPINITVTDEKGAKRWRTPLKTVMMNDRVSQKFDDYIDQGRGFEASDFILEKAQEPIPIILGSGYRELYKLEEQFSLELLGKAMTFQVIGFYKVGTHFAMGVGAGHEVKLDNIIAMPAFMPNYEPEGRKEKFQHAMMWAELTTGFVPIEGRLSEIDDATFDNHEKRMQAMAEQYGLAQLYKYPFRPLGFVWNNHKE